MTASDWLTCRDPVAMLSSLGKKVSERGLRLTACACCRLAWDALTDEGQEAVACIERYADDLASTEELDTAVGRANEVVATYRQHTPAYHAALAVRNAGQVGAFEAWHASNAVECAVESLNLTQTRGRGHEIGSVELPMAADAACGLIRDIAGRVFERARLGRSERNSTVRALAHAAYSERLLPSGILEPDRLAVLADSLEEIGAPDPLVAHLRLPGPHVRGCFVVDSCLGKR